MSSSGNVCRMNQVGNRICLGEGREREREKARLRRPTKSTKTDPISLQFYIEKRSEFLLSSLFSKGREEAAANRLVLSIAIRLSFRYCDIWCQRHVNEREAMTASSSPTRTTTSSHRCKHRDRMNQQTAILLLSFCIYRKIIEGGMFDEDDASADPVTLVY